MVPHVTVTLIDGVGVDVCDAVPAVLLGVRRVMALMLQDRDRRHIRRFLRGKFLFNLLRRF